MPNWKLKSCPRCGGDLLIEKDLLYGWYEKCFQCSFSRDLKESAEPKEVLVKSDRARITSR